MIQPTNPSNEPRAEIPEVQTTPLHEPRISPAQVTEPTRTERSIVALIKELRDEAFTLFRKEIQLAKTEMSEKSRVFGRNAAFLGVGGLIAYSGLMFLLLAATCAIIVGLRAAGLGPNIYSWLAPLIVGVVVAVIGYALIQKAISTLRRESIVPQRTVETLQENTQWIANKAR